MAIGFPFAERYLHGASPVHRADARVKLAVTVAYIFVITVTPIGAWAAIALLGVPVLVFVALARLSGGLVLRRSLLAAPFLLAVLPLMFTKPGEAAFTLPLVGWDASWEGLEAVATILLKSWLSVVVAVVLTATTPAAELVHALQGLRVPRLLTGVVYFTYRYLFTIGEEAQRLMRARDSRSARIEGYRDGRTIGWRARVLGHMVGSLFLRSFERSERVYAAMQARGYDGQLRFLEHGVVQPREAVLGAAVIAYAVVVQVMARV